jgi:S-adenosylmethionine:tRNA ribosyltransferase-isomerase
MKTRDFSFNLPQDRIAQYPPPERGESRLMFCKKADKAVEHMQFSDLPNILEPGSVLVMNDSKVRKARVFGTASDTGGRVEFLFVEKIDERTWKAIVSKSKKQKLGKRFRFGEEIHAIIKDQDAETKVVEFESVVDEDFFEKYGHIPLPPYIKRDDETSDESRYQTVYAQNTGSVAAPTAGLHFSDTMLAQLAGKGVRIARITLHVGIGTFLPIRSENIEEHRMHAESYIIPEETSAVVNEAKQEGRKIIAVGTTVVRTLESAGTTNGLGMGEGSTSLFIYPGYRFKIIDGMLTNFHTPESSLLVLVSAFAGTDFIRNAYSKAIESGYRFFSYGDAMLIL